MFKKKRELNYVVVVTRSEDGKKLNIKGHGDRELLEDLRQAFREELAREIINKPQTWTSGEFSY
jgi:hypothetical protein